jgi:drug/metabolite transporter (DMT)-like permease
VYSSGIDTSPKAASQSYNPQVAIPSAILAGILSGVALINLHRVKDLDTRSVVTHFSGVATTLSLLVWLVVPLDPPTRAYDQSSLLRIILIGVAATIGQLCLTMAFSRGAPARVSVVGLSQVAVAVVVKGVLEGRIPTVGSLVGMILIVAATIWVILASDAASNSRDPKAQGTQSEP